jgi:hypothetical protein
MIASTPSVPGAIRPPSQASSISPSGPYSSSLRKRGGAASRKAYATDPSKEVGRTRRGRALLGLVPALSVGLTGHTPPCPAGR